MSYEEINKQQRKWFKQAHSEKPEEAMEAINEAHYIALTFLQDFRHKRAPDVPEEIKLLRESEHFKGMSAEKKMETLIKVWRKLKPVMDEIGKVKAENLSNRHYLSEMYRHFKKIGDEGSAERVLRSIETFPEEKQEDGWREKITHKKTGTDSVRNVMKESMKWVSK